MWVQVSALQSELRRLTNMMSDISRKNNQPTVVHVGGRSGWTVLIYPVCIGGAVLYLYCRITGNSVWDMLYVSRSSLTSFKTTVQEGMAKMWDEMRKQKDEIFRVVGAMGKKQDEMKDSQDQLMAKQDQMDERLRRVSCTAGSGGCALWGGWHEERGVHAMSCCAISGSRLQPAWHTVLHMATHGGAASTLASVYHALPSVQTMCSYSVCITPCAATGG